MSSEEARKAFRYSRELIECETAHYLNVVNLLDISNSFLLKGIHHYEILKVLIKYHHKKYAEFIS